MKKNSVSKSISSILLGILMVSTTVSAQGIDRRGKEWKNIMADWRVLMKLPDDQTRAEKIEAFLAKSADHVESINGSTLVLSRLSDSYIRQGHFQKVEDLFSKYGKQDRHGSFLSAVGEMREAKKNGELANFRQSKINDLKFEKFDHVKGETKELVKFFKEPLGPHCKQLCGLILGERLIKENKNKEAKVYLYYAMNSKINTINSTDAKKRLISIGEVHLLPNPEDKARRSQSIKEWYDIFSLPHVERIKKFEEILKNPDHRVMEEIKPGEIQFQLSVSYLKLGEFEKILKLSDNYPKEAMLDSGFLKIVDRVKLAKENGNLNRLKQEIANEGMLGIYTRQKKGKVDTKKLIALYHKPMRRSSKVICAVLIGEILIQEGKREEAKPYLNEVLKLSHDEDEAYFMKARTLLISIGEVNLLDKKLVKSKRTLLSEEWQKIIQLPDLERIKKLKEIIEQPGHPLSMVNRHGITYKLLSDSYMTLGEFDKVLDLHKKYPRATTLSNLFSENVKRVEEAKKKGTLNLLKQEIATEAEFGIYSKKDKSKMNSKDLITIYNKPIHAKYKQRCALLIGEKLIDEGKNEEAKPYLYAAMNSTLSRFSSKKAKKKLISIGEVQLLPKK